MPSLSWVSCTFTSRALRQHLAAAGVPGVPRGVLLAEPVIAHVAKRKHLIMIAATSSENAVDFSFSISGSKKIWMK